MWEPHLDLARGLRKQPDLLYGFLSCPDKFLDLLILDYNTTKPSRKKTGGKKRKATHT